MSLEGKHVLVGVGGGIAAYKAVLLVRELGRRRALVKVAMTPSATRFVGASTFGGITGTPPVTDLWDPSYPGEVHVELAAWTDAIVVAPATANLLARAAAGMADDALLATLSCAECPVVYAPAMHERMWLSPPTVRNVERLREDGARFAGPLRGPLASGEEGWGRLAEPEEIADTVAAALVGGDQLAGKTLVISVGPTLEDIDPVRFISNRSSGRMGFALASVARDRGARVVVVMGPTSVQPPPGVEVHAVRSAREMQQAVNDVADDADAIIMTAAVADYRPAEMAEQKIKKTGNKDHMSIELVKNPDILAGLGAARKGTRPALVGFAMETHDVVAYARRKLTQKKVDFMVANEASVGFGRDDTQVTIVDHDGDHPQPPGSKMAAAGAVLDRLAKLLA
ncbi:MAG: bifunctional phosphopantothenoylcysteine decarboxylase/phosphopantothenate--cysteine ligase CoaBC [Myxococcales bacterium]|nr:bifunctional phosphopantothenoylcysteine decarboxylase/phosphopantothenate--cysteine ligase CoaBC [Myxococcales bacterium]